MPSSGRCAGEHSARNAMDATRAVESVDSVDTRWSLSAVADVEGCCFGGDLQQPSESDARATRRQITIVSGTRLPVTTRTST